MSTKSRLFLAFCAGLAVAAGAAGVLLASGALEIERDVEFGPLVLGAVGAALLIAVAAAAFARIVRGHCRSMKSLADGISEMSRGDAPARLPVRAAGEIGDIARSLSEMQSAHEGALSRLSSVSDELGNAAGASRDAFSGVRDGALAQSRMAEQSCESTARLREELFEVSQAIEKLAARVGEKATAISEMDKTIGGVAEMIGGLTTSIGNASAITREGDKGARVLSEDLADLREGIDAARRSLTEVRGGAERASTEARGVAETMSKLQAEAQSIGAAIEKVIEGSDAAHGSNERILEVTANLSDRLGGIDDVIEVIRGLAERTKLLSINASIIASEAGEHGRAFAVVAKEVKDLAGSTSGAIAEISRALGALKEGFATTVARIREGQAEVNRGVGLARDAVVLLRSIPAQVLEASEYSDSILSRTESQLVRSREVEEVILKIAATLEQVGDLLADQIANNERTLELYRSVGETSDRVLHSTRDHAFASGEVTRAVERISGDFQALADKVRTQLATVGDMAGLSEEALEEAERNRRAADDLARAIADVGERARSLSSDLARLRSGDGRPKGG